MVSLANVYRGNLSGDFSSIDGHHLFVLDECTSSQSIEEYLHYAHATEDSNAHVLR
jgi:hypothetical protein